MAMTHAVSSIFPNLVAADGPMCLKIDIWLSNALRWRLAIYSLVREGNLAFHVMRIYDFFLVRSRISFQLAFVYSPFSTGTAGEPPKGAAGEKGKTLASALGMSRCWVFLFSFVVFGVLGAGKMYKTGSFWDRRCRLRPIALPRTLLDEHATVVFVSFSIFLNFWCERCCCCRRRGNNRTLVIKK